MAEPPRPSIRRTNPVLMISITIKSGSINTLIVSYYLAAALWSGVCPGCQKPYQHYGTYTRQTPILFGPMSIQRVYCVQCGKSHALLPCFIIPYARVLDVVREAAIVGICFNEYTIEELAELLHVDPTSVARWWRIFRNKAGVLMMALAKKLAYSPRLADWVCGSLRTVHEEARKILELMGRCQAIYSPNFAFCRFAWVNVFNPYLLFECKGIHDKLSGADSAG